jgi:carboxypeptidase PM20D1
MSGINVYAHYTSEEDYSDLDYSGACERLASAIACKTIDQGDGTDDAPFERLHALVRSSYPHIMAASSFEEVGRNLLITCPGTEPSLPCVLLLAHQDVVPVVPGTEKDWLHDAFAGELDETFIWGRGALDIKDMLMGELEALEYLLARGERPRRTVILAFGADEETSSTGATEMAGLLKERGLRAEWLLDEGTTTMVDGAMWGAAGHVLTDVCISQKGYLDLRLDAHGEGGHSSNPFGGTSLEHLCVAIARIAESRPTPKLTPIVEDTFRTLAPYITEEPLRTLVQDVHGNAEKIAALAATKRDLYPFVATTMAVDMLQGGSAAPNVMPGDASATINFRLLPGTTADDVLAWVERAVQGTGVTATLVHTTPAGRMDSTDGPGYAEVAEALGHYYGNVDVVPSFVCGGTDAIRYEAVCDSILRVIPFRPTPEEEATGVHGVNERISRRTYAQGIRVLVRLLERTIL